MKSQQLSPADAYRQMSTIRHFEHQALDLSRDGEVAGSIHLCLGQEAIPVGTMSALQPQDRVLSTYRGHGWALACGSSAVSLLAEIAQRGEGLNGGRGGSPLLSDPANGFLGENSIVGAGVPIASGVALAAVAQSTDRVVVTSIGDGAMNQGSTTEGMVFAASRNLPVIFICENNGWSEMTPIGSTTRGDHLARRGQGLGIESFVVDGGDPFAVAEAVAHAADLCRRGQGPVLLECKTVRLSGHYNRDVEHYRSQEDKDAAALADPLVRLVSESEDLSQSLADEIEEDVARFMADVGARVRAMDAPGVGDVLDHVYAPYSAPAQAARSLEPAKETTYFRAVNEALKDALATRPEVLVYGEDVGFAGGIFGVTRGLQKAFGPDRVFDTPIAESAILGSAVGAAMEGMRPVVEIMWADFVFVALDQIINQAANVRYVSRSRLSAPLTIRMQQGVTPGSCAQHSQSIEAILAHIPGIKVGLPATPQEAYDMTVAAIADDDPIVLIEHRAMYQDSGPVTFGGEVQSASGARVRREGTDVCIVAWGSMVDKALLAAGRLSDTGIEARVVDLRWLRPLDAQTLAESVATTSGRIVVVQEATLSGGFAAEVSAHITEHHFSQLTAPVLRIGTPEVRMPSAPALQDALIPTVGDIVNAVQRQFAVR